jgi:hypothetical protein
VRSVVIFVVLAMACGPAVEVVPPVKQAATLPPKVEPSPAPRAKATRCVAEPSTVYGKEEVRFRVEGEGLPDATAELELRDEHERTISKGSMTLPGELRQPGLPSGDFVLIVGSNRISCVVTVNRELQRASSQER